MFDLRNQCSELLCPNSRAHESFHMLPWPQRPHAHAIPVLRPFSGWLVETLTPVMPGNECTYANTHMGFNTNPSGLPLLPLQLEETSVPSNQTGMKTNSFHCT